MTDIRAAYGPLHTLASDVRTRTGINCNLFRWTTGKWDFENGPFREWLFGFIVRVGMG